MQRMASVGSDALLKKQWSSMWRRGREREYAPSRLGCMWGKIDSAVQTQIAPGDNKQHVTILDAVKNLHV